MDPERDPYIDGLLRRLGPPATYQGSVRRLQSRSAGAIGRMPSAYEFDAWRAAVRRRRAIRAAVELAMLAVLCAMIAISLSNR